MGFAQNAATEPIYQATKKHVSPTSGIVQQPKKPPAVIPSKPILSEETDEKTLLSIGAEIERNEPIIRLLAHIRKAGMDILFPQMIHDKVSSF